MTLSNGIQEKKRLYRKFHGHNMGMGNKDRRAPTATSRWSKI